MAEVLGISASALVRWTRRRNEPAGRRGPRGRPEVIPASVRERIRACYLEHYRQWGPQVLAAWCRRERLGAWSSTTIAAVVADLRPEKPERQDPIRYEITASDVMWSEDGTGFRENGKKKELLVVQDEHSRLKLGHRLVGGPADEEAVYQSLRAAFERYGAPLVLKHDGGSIFHGEKGAIDERHQELRTGHAAVGCPRIPSESARGRLPRPQRGPAATGSAGPHGSRGLRPRSLPTSRSAGIQKPGESVGEETARRSTVTQ
jgi:hypothetical protein